MDLANSTRIAKIFPATILLQLIYKSTGAIIIIILVKMVLFKFFKPVKREFPNKLPDPEFPADKLLLLLLFYYYYYY